MEKYIEHYFEHYLVCFSTLGCENNDNGFYKLAKTYIQVEGKGEFLKLIEEISRIETNNDWDYFVEHHFDHSMTKDIVRKIAANAKTVYGKLGSYC